MSVSKRSPIMCLIVAVFSWIGQACSPLGKPVDKEISDSYFYSKTGKHIVYCRSGNWFELGKNKVEMADVETFNVISNDFGKDKNHAFVKAQTIKLPVDLETFRYAEGEFMYMTTMDKNNVYGYNRNDKMYIVEKADPTTFERLDYDWSKDSSHRYYNDTLVEVDYETFEVLNDFFCKDKYKVYRYSYKTYLNAIKADPNSIKKFNKEYVYDKDNFYRYALYVRQQFNDSLLVMPYDALESAKVLDDTYLQIDNKVYAYGYLLKGVDAAEFELVEKSLYAKDTKHVYYWGALVEGAVASSFEAINGQYGKDEFQVFFQDKVVEEANPATFKKAKDWYYYEDGVNKYDEGKKLLEEDIQ